MKTITTIALAALITVGVVTANAQATFAPPAGQRHHMMQRVMSELNLSKGQFDQIKGIREQARARMKAIRSSNQPLAVKKAEAKRVHMNTREKIMQVLTPAQREKLLAIRAHRKANRGVIKP